MNEWKFMSDSCKCTRFVYTNTKWMKTTKQLSASGLQRDENEIDKKRWLREAVLSYLTVENEILLFKGNWE